MATAEIGVDTSPDGSRWIPMVLWGGLVVALLALTGVIWGAPEHLKFVPILLLAMLAVPILLRDELLVLCAILLAFAIVSGYEAGFQIEEALFGLAYLGYLGYWFASRTLVFRRPFVCTKFDLAVLLFLVYVTASTGLTFVFGGNPSAMASEWLSISMLAFYFPIKEFVSRDPRGARAIVTTLGVLTFVIATRNLLEYVYGLGQAEQVYQITTGRAVVNEHMIMMAGIGALVLLLFARTRTQQILLSAALGLFTAGIVIS
ncbi:MAG: hypothetical protein R3282_01205, partial [Rhodothermales bacterium]|nr:hypothetical protein [Rhodothermales bacterium]